MISWIKAASPDFVLITGDCVMAKGDDPAPWDRFFDVFAPLYSRPNHLLYAVPGNHDMDGEYSAALRQWLRRWDLPGQKVFYSFNRGPAHVTGLMITRGALFRKWNVGGRSITQLQWLKEDLQSIPNTVKWKFIFQHEPGTRYCRLCAPNDGAGSPAVSGFVEPLAFEAGVDIIFRGHQHMHERTYPINIDTWKRDDRNGMAMITTGGGNRAFRPLNPADAVPYWFDAVIALHRLHYCKVVIRGNRLTLEAVDLEGRVFDRFEVTKNEDGTRWWKGLPQKSVFLPSPEMSSVGREK